jgi:purine-nucleoside phosphorylase
MKAGTISGYQRAREAAEFLRSHWKVSPRLVIVLGSGLSEVTGHLRNRVTIPFRRVPHFPRPTVEGHTGLLHLGQWKGIDAAILEGRAHLYEGYSPKEVVLPVRALALAGVQFFVLTCAAGGISRQASPGSLMVFSDHLNFLGANPLAGPHDAGWGERFVDLTEAYDARLRRLARKAAATLGLKVWEGVYAALPGPSYETPAEIRALKCLGADAVGMSTVPEVIALRQMDARVLAIATITNRAAGLAHRPLSHAEVLAAGKSASRDLARLLDAILPVAVQEARRQPPFGQTAT